MSALFYFFPVTFNLSFLCFDSCLRIYQLQHAILVLAYQNLYLFTPENLLSFQE